MAGSSVPFPQLDQPSSSNFSAHILKSDATTIRASLAVLGKDPDKLDFMERADATELAEECAKILVASPDTLPAGLQEKVKEALGVAPTAFVNLDANHLLLPRELRTPERLTHDLVHQITLRHHFQLDDEQAQVHSLLRSNDEFKSFDLIPFFNAISQHMKRKKRFMLLWQYDTSLEKQLEYLVDLHNRKPVLHEHLMELLKFASRIDQPQHLKSCSRSPCPMCAHIAITMPDSDLYPALRLDAAPGPGEPSAGPSQPKS